MKHKCTVVVLVMVICLSGTVFGDVGFKAGLSLANTTFEINGDDANFGPGWDLENLIGFQIGGYLNFNLSKTLYLQPEVYFSRKGAVIVDDSSMEITVGENHHEVVIKEQQTNKLDYLEIPLLFNLSLFTSDRHRFSLLCGGYGALFIGGKKDIKAEFDGDSAERSSDLDNTIKSTDYGYVIGASYELNLDSVDLIVDVRYTQGLTNVDDSGDENVSIHNRTFFILMGIGF